MAFLPDISHDIGISDIWVDRAEAFLFIVWLLYLPILAKFVLQISMAMISVFLQASHHMRNQLFGIDQEIKEYPRVSVIIPAYNEEVGILKTINSVLRTKYPNLQVVVVNDGSTDGTHKKISDFLEEYRDEEAACLEAETDSESLDAFRTVSSRPEIKYLCLENRGKAKAMNIAIPYVSGSIVVTVDADSVMDKRAILRLVECFGEDQEVGAVAGNVIVANRSKPIGMIQQIEYLSGFFCKRADSMFNAVYIIGGAAAAYRKQVLDKVGSFDASIITEDIELSMRILSMGYKTRYAHNAVVYTEGPSEWTGLCNQRLRWKYGRLKTFWKYTNLFFRLFTGKGVRNNLYLTWVILPLAAYGDVLLLMNWLVIAVGIAYTLFVDNGPFFVVLLSLAGLTLLQIAVDCKRKFHANLVLLVPVSWFAAIMIDLVEFQALVRSIRRLVQGQGLKWQKWNRVGIAEQEIDDDE